MCTSAKGYTKVTPKSGGEPSLGDSRDERGATLKHHSPAPNEHAKWTMWTANAFSLPRHNFEVGTQSDVLNWASFPPAARVNLTNRFKWKSCRKEENALDVQKKKGSENSPPFHIAVTLAHYPRQWSNTAFISRARKLMHYPKLL